MQWEELNTKRYYDYIYNIINTRGQWNIPDGEYFECHHIIPKCFGGLGRRREKHSNTIWLFAREHFEVHMILAEDNKDCKELVYAFHRMTNNKNEKYIASPDEYELSRTLFAKLRRQMRLGQKASDETRLKMSKIRKDKPSKRKGKKYPELHDKLSKIFSGAGNPRYGVKLSEETKRKISESEKGKIAWNRIKVMCIETGIIYDSVVAANAAECTDINYSLKTGAAVRKSGHHYVKI